MVLSGATVELAYPHTAIARAIDAAGFVVALHAQQQGLRACTLTSSKFIDRASRATASLQAFFRPSTDELAALGDDAWIECARSGLAHAIAVRGAPLHAWVWRWRDALPMF